MMGGGGACAALVLCSPFIPDCRNARAPLCQSIDQCMVGKCPSRRPGALHPVIQPTSMTYRNANAARYIKGTMMRIYDNVSCVRPQDGASAPTHHPHNPRPYRLTDVPVFRFSYFDEYRNK